jgi:hypothetical protein
MLCIACHVHVRVFLLQVPSDSHALVHRAWSIADVPLVLHDITGLGPVAAMEYVAKSMPSDRLEKSQWVAKAKVAAILGSCPHSRASFRSGVCCYIQFAERLLGGGHHGFPPTVDGLLLWSHNFRCVGTYSNYVGHVRTLCLAMDVPMPSADHPALARAKSSIVKRMLFSPRPRMFIQRTMVRNMCLSVERGLLSFDMAMLWLTAYVFLLRVPSEALPLVRGTQEDLGHQCTVFLDSDGCVCLRLRRRKNRPGGSLLRRKCACTACPRICPVHVLWLQFFAKLPLGAQPWIAVSADNARKKLRTTLGRLGVASPDLYGTHDFRRGHAKVRA